MTAPTEDRGQLSHPVLGDLAEWYEVFRLYAATAPAGNPHFTGAHATAAVVGPERVAEGLVWFESRYGPVAEAGLLPDLKTMRAALGLGIMADVGVDVHRHSHVAGDDGGTALPVGEGDVTAFAGAAVPDVVEFVYRDVVRYDEGSPCHNFWHWLNGTS
ncbi:hypothetical protein IOD16_21920 [Saccharothrix sp. 6-C]|uniref:Uncharacterized protein n=1 Tax=Saccharothrix texasensis TaxID=103734 RepID=A0A3N1HIA1_9PSEU|nr:MULTISPECIES: hypothetical protein [Saccharothrix]QQQ73899.1 hypothetical protein IOD16_21920 [Saccharothrix sp. 6-C]ROP42216.1 hypothetical protein EDD40_7712 [Saccharothrix texasensis]